MSSGLRWFKGKQLVSILRKGDYAHAGGEEAILQTFAPFKKKSDRKILDVGCGQGGTANFIQNHGWGKVTGIDIDEPSIQYAKEKYKKINFYAADVLDASSVLKNSKFDIICLYNSFYAFPEQEQALSVLRKLAHEKTTLMIFDYTDLCENNNPFTNVENKNSVTIPIRKCALENMLIKSSWELKDEVDISNNYKRWYLDLINKIKANKNKIIADFGVDYYSKAESRYTTIYNQLISGNIGGSIFYINPLEN